MYSETWIFWITFFWNATSKNVKSRVFWISKFASHIMYVCPKRSQRLFTIPLPLLYIQSWCISATWQLGVNDRMSEWSHLARRTHGGQHSLLKVILIESCEIAPNCERFIAFTNCERSKSYTHAISPASRYVAWKSFVRILSLAPKVIGANSLNLNIRD